MDSGHLRHRHRLGFPPSRTGPPKDFRGHFLHFAETTMTPSPFQVTVEQIAAADSRFHAEAYLFVKESLDFTVRRLRKKSDSRPPGGHVSAAELLEGIRLYGLQQFGPMTTTVLEHWGITRSEHFGDIVFILIRAGLFGKTEEDALEDFSKGLDFHEAFIKPFEPSRPLKTEPAAPIAGKRSPARHSGKARNSGASTSKHNP
jgi:uncharacterized repeat protein (TIGR04138 family)